MIEILDTPKDGIIGIKMSGKLHDKDYPAYVSAVETTIDSFGKIRMLILFEDFHGWDLGALWDDIKFSAKHCNDIEKIALVGDKEWEKWMSKACNPFTRATVLSFEPSHLEAAWKWVEEES